MIIGDFETALIANSSFEQSDERPAEAVHHQGRKRTALII